MKILILGHPRCGSGFSAYYLNLLGLNISHENTELKCLDEFDGLSNWGFTIKHSPNDNIFPRWGMYGDDWRKICHFDKRIVHIRNPFNSFDAIIHENRFRKYSKPRLNKKGKIS